jgi:heme oxygenase
MRALRRFGAASYGRCHRGHITVLALSLSVDAVLGDGTTRVTAPPWMLVRLALETRDHHAQADEDRLAALQIRTTDEYRVFLGRVFGFEVRVEQELARLEDEDAVLVRSGMRAVRLHDDLAALGMTRDEIAMLPRSGHVRIPSWSHAFGWLFVLERHALLSGLIRRHLLHAIGRDVAPACSYLAMYGETPGARFRDFGRAVSAYAARHRPSTVVAAAVDAFRAERHWYLTAAVAMPETNETRRAASADEQHAHEPALGHQGSELQ